MITSIRLALALSILLLSACASSGTSGNVPHFELLGVNLTHWITIAGTDKQQEDAWHLFATQLQQCDEDCMVALDAAMEASGLRDDLPTPPVNEARLDWLAQAIAVREFELCFVCSP